MQWTPVTPLPSRVQRQCHAQELARYTNTVALCKQYRPNTILPMRGSAFICSVLLPLQNQTEQPCIVVTPTVTITLAMFGLGVWPYTSVT
jgi:hypothetical protein